MSSRNRARSVMPTVLTAATASMTLPGPTGSPAARKVRAKCIRLASSRSAGFVLATMTPVGCVILAVTSPCHCERGASSGDGLAHDLARRPQRLRP